jgi:hypothetical protein
MRGLFHLRRSGGLGLVAGLVLAPVLSAAPSGAALPAAIVDFAPAVAASLRDRYGTDETAVLRSAIVTAVSRETEGVAVAPGLTVTVTVRDITPTHPTRRQLADDPALDATRTRFIGGADLGGEVRDAQGRVVVSVMSRYYPATVGLGSASLDPWADARLAIDQFAVKLAAALRRISRSANPAA